MGSLLCRDDRIVLSGLCEFLVSSLRCRDDRIVGRECGECGCVEWIVCIASECPPVSG